MDAVTKLVIEHKWIALAALAIGLFVRLLRDDNAFPLTLPPAFKRWKPWIAVGLGVVAGVLEHVANGTAWGEAIVAGLVAGVLPILGHQLGIESLRGGKEVPMPKAPPPGASMLLAVGLALALTGCPPAARSPSAQSVAKLAMNSIALGVRLANEACRDRAQTIFVEEGDKQRALELSQKCTGEYQTARKALMAAAFAIDGWSDASNHGKAVCALSEATTALSLTVEVVKAGGMWTPPREVTLALQAVAVLSDMVEAKQCEVSS